MIVVADTSPFVALVNIGCLHILPGLFDRVVIPEEVARELGDARRPEMVRRFIEARPEWLDVRQPSRLLDLPGIDRGEVAAILLDAANAGLIDDLRSVFDRLAATGFRVSPGILATLLARHDAVKGRSA
jgi:predicted nucleic acid-binding protein